VIYQIDISITGLIENVCLPYNTNNHLIINGEKETFKVEPKTYVQSLLPGKQDEG